MKEIRNKEDYRCFTWWGGYWLSECVITERIMDAIDNDDVEDLLCSLIESDEIDCFVVDILSGNEFDEYMNDERYCYIDNTTSDITDKDNCYFVLIQEIKFGKKENKK